MAERHSHPALPCGFGSPRLGSPQLSSSPQACRRRNIVPWATAVLACCAAIGCGKQGPPRGIVKGRVTVGDRPVTDARLMFSNTESGEAIHVPIDGAGGYEAKNYQGPGLLTGTYKVAVLPGRIRYSEANQPKMDSSQFQTSKATTAAAATSEIPKRFRSIETSGISIVVKAGDNPPFDFKLDP